MKQAVHHGHIFRPAAYIVALMSLWLCVGCGASVQNYTHDLPKIYRSTVFGFGQSAVVRACGHVLEGEGFTVAVSDTSSGVVYTDAKVVPPIDPEIGGEWELVYLVETKAIGKKTMVTAEIVAQGAMASGTWPISMKQGYARSLYRDLFKKMQAVLVEQERSN